MIDKYIIDDMKVAEIGDFRYCGVVKMASFWAHIPEFAGSSPAPATTKA